MAEFDRAWFIATPFGQPFAAVDTNIYDIAHDMAEAELANVKCWCSKLYPTALQIKLSLVLAQMGSGAAVAVTPNLAPTGNAALVVGDKVGDVDRKYEIVKQDGQVTASSPANMLASIIARCRAPLAVGAVLARSFTTGSGCGCGPDIDRMGGDKADN